MRSSMNAVWGSGLFLALSVSAMGANRAPTISLMPSVSTTTVVTDGTTQYSVTLRASDADGYNDLRDMRVMLNYVRSGGDQTKVRGYLAWGQAESDVTRYGGNWAFAAAIGGGRWAYETVNWGGVTYIAPMACQVTTTGAASGGMGTRTVTWTFQARAAWANNPVINTADAFIADYEINVGWRENPTEFDVVPSACVFHAATPAPPVITAASVSSISFQIPAAGNESDLLAVRISPPVNGQQFVQANGTIGSFPVWRARANWATTTVTSLGSSTVYGLSARAMSTAAGACPSDWGVVSTGSTTLLSPEVDVTAAGLPIHKGVLGMDAQAKVVSANLDRDTLAASFNTSMRFGGDGYNWKTRTAEWNSSTRSTLQALRDARDRNSYVQMCLNTRGIGSGNGSTWAYTDQSAETLAALAADWVYYCNKLVPLKRQGDALTAQEQAILDSMSWGSDAKLLAPGEAATSRVDYWEIGNEPEGPYPPPALSPADYAARYNTITKAMLAVDPTIKVGPCVMSADNGNAWLDAVFANRNNRVDFVAYHPYGPLYSITRSTGVLNANDLAIGMNRIKQQQADRRQKVVDRLTANNRSASTPLIASEWNPSSWEGTWYFGLHQTVAQGLGVAETIFSFAELGFVAAQYWDFPNYPSSTAIETPGFKVFKEMQARQPARLVYSCVDGAFRLYVTLNNEGNQLVVWAINMSETDDKPVRLQLTGPFRATRAIERRLANTSGDTSLATRNIYTDAADKIAWIESDRTGQLDPRDFTVTIEDATLTMLIFDIRRLARVDYDADDDVDQDDFAFLQTCLSGPIAPTAPGCGPADLDGDGNVDQDDVLRFAGCLNGPTIPAVENCPN